MASRSILSTSLVALAAALVLAGCSKTADTANSATDANVAAIDNQAAAVPPEDLALPAGDNAIVEDESTAPAIQIAQVPAPAPSAPAAETAPLTDAIAAEQLIDTGTGITRVQQADGWAWMQNGQIIRTASADGHRVSYFRRGMTTPYLVQQDGRSYAYDNGRVAREYDDHGRASAPNAQHQREAQQAADRARQQHDRARQASRTAPHVDRGRDHDGSGSMPDHTPPSSQPSPDHHGGSNGGHGSAGGNDHGRGHAAPQPSPTPSPSPSPHTRPSPDRHGGHSDPRAGDRSNGY
jgi:hypothetical protein